MHQVCNINANIWIQANAGSGKTTALVYRFLSLLLNNVHFYEILCVTYTNIATNEMKSRILSKLKEWSIIDEEVLIKDLKYIGFNESYVLKARVLYNEVLNSSENFKISTIHSFCVEILSKYSQNFTENNYKIIDEYYSNQIYQFILNKIDNYIKNKEKNFELLKKSVDFLVNYFDGIFKLDIIISSFIQNRITFDRDILSYKEDNIENLAKLLLFKEQSDLYNIDLLNDENEIIRNLLNQNESFQILIQNNSYLHALDIEILNSIKNSKNFWKSLEKLIYSKENIRSKLLKIDNIFVQELIKKIDVFFIKRNKILEAKSSYFSIILVIFCSKFYKIYAERENLISFDDIIERVVNLLSNSEMQWINYNLDLKISHIMLDEAQDTSSNGWKIIQLISDEFFSGYGTRDKNIRTIFIVGDSKQSIYSFQGANLQLFKENRLYFQKKSKACDVDFLEINLQNSYRSSQEILNFIDEKICNDAERKISFTEKNEKIQHNSCVKNDNSCIKIINFEENIKEKSENKYDWIQNLEYRQQNNEDSDVELIYKHLKDLIKDGKKVEDIMILFSTRQQQDNLFYKIFDRIRQDNIPVEMIGDEKNFILVKDLITVFKFIALPIDNFNLGCVLKSDIFGLSDAEILFIQKENDSSLYDKLLQNNGNENIIRVKTMLFNLVNAYNHCENLLDFIILFAKICQLSEIYLKYLAKIYDFLIKNQKISKIFLDLLIFDMENQKIFENREKSSNKLTISTIHGAKGSEARHIFLILNKKSNNLHKNPFMKHEFGWFLYHTSSSFHILETLKEQLLFEQYCEDMRLLYVGATRTKETLFIFQEKNKLFDNCITC